LRPRCQNFHYTDFLSLAKSLGNNVQNKTSKRNNVKTETSKPQKCPKLIMSNGKNGQSKISKPITSNVQNVKFYYYCQHDTGFLHFQYWTPTLEIKLRRYEACLKISSFIIYMEIIISTNHTWIIVKYPFWMLYILWIVQESDTMLTVWLWAWFLYDLCFTDGMNSTTYTVHCSWFLHDLHMSYEITFLVWLFV
jgi:hypothetical protein